MPIRDVQSNAQNIATETTAATLAKEVGVNVTASANNLAVDVNITGIEVD